MKLTKQKLEQLIQEEYVRRVGDEGKPTNYPEYADKLTTLAKSDPKQAASLADALDEPLDIEFDPSKMKKMRIQRPGEEADRDLHFDFIMQQGEFISAAPDMQEVYAYAQKKGLDPQKTYDSIMRDYKRIMSSTYINAPKTEVERRKELEDLYGLDLRPDWMKKNKPRYK